MAIKQDSTRKFYIRNAVEADLPVLVDFLAKLALHVAGAPPLKLKKNERSRLMQVLRTSLSDPAKLIIVAATSDDNLIGMGYLYVVKHQGIWEQAEETEAKSAFIDDVWVEPDFRNQGIFSALIRELIKFAESHDVHELILEYAVSNKEAEAVWTRLGFKLTGVRAAAFTKTVQAALAKGQ
ncbi:MAG: GNAT family N-acetyltransferase [Methylophaga sp.]|nr:GNAT family N-acetyltransferase [Methylophaga sp.]